MTELGKIHSPAWVLNLIAEEEKKPEAIRDKNALADLYYRLIESKLKSGKFEDVFKQIEKIRELSPEHPDTSYLLCEYALTKMKEKKIMTSPSNSEERNWNLFFLNDALATAMGYVKSFFTEREPQNKLNKSIYDLLKAPGQAKDYLDTIIETLITLKNTNKLDPRPYALLIEAYTRREDPKDDKILIDLITTICDQNEIMKSVELTHSLSSNETIGPRMISLLGRDSAVFGLESHTANLFSSEEAGHNMVIGPVGNCFKIYGANSQPADDEFEMLLALRTVQEKLVVGNKPVYVPSNVYRIKSPEKTILIMPKMPGQTLESRLIFSQNENDVVVKDEVIDIVSSIITSFQLIGEHLPLVDLSSKELTLPNGRIVDYFTYRLYHKFIRTNLTYNGIALSEDAEMRFLDAFKPAAEILKSTPKWLSLWFTDSNPSNILVDYRGVKVNPSLGDAVSQSIISRVDFEMKWKVSGFCDFINAIENPYVIGRVDASRKRSEFFSERYLADIIKGQWKTLVESGNADRKNFEDYSDNLAKNRNNRIALSSLLEKYIPLFDPSTDIISLLLNKYASGVFVHCFMSGRKIKDMASVNSQIELIEKDSPELKAWRLDVDTKSNNNLRYRKERALLASDEHKSSNWAELDGYMQWLDLRERLKNSFEHHAYYAQSSARELGMTDLIHLLHTHYKWTAIG